jgi:hypothetical protein
MKGMERNMKGKSRPRADSCHGPEPAGLIEIEPPPQGMVPNVATRLSVEDRWGGFLVRWAIGRTRYRVAPGLYAVGKPNAGSAVLVTANYKLSFDLLRKELGGLAAWILVLDTHGINVWCAAGKGTFGTAELVRRIRLTGLHNRVSHRTLILPQLGAPGVAGYKVTRQTGFHVVYGPVRARDIKPFLAGGMKADAEMRSVTFNLRERLVVVPTELVEALKYSLIIFVLLAAWAAVVGGFSLRGLLSQGIPILGALLAGTVAVPVLLPWIPFRSFALKGWLAGLLWSLGASLIQDAGPARFAGNLLLLPALSAYMALNFTGNTTFTSQSGVNREIRMFARPLAASAILGILVLVGRLVW